ncbi:MAG: SDR family NAD(P)-dependent oxidoreductase, partial [Terriglobales bacterium]
MKFSVGRICAVLLVLLLATGAAFASAYNANPKLVVIVIIDQFRPDFLDRAHDQLGPAGFRLLTERGAYFTGCYYDYANTETAPGHATLFTGAYSDAHGIAANQWWDARAKRMVSSVFDNNTRLVGVEGAGASPHNLLSDTLGDELKLSTDGKARVFTVSLKDRAAIRPHKPFTELTVEDWEAVRGVVLDGALYLTRAVIPSMVKNSYGRILFFTGDGSFTGGKGRAHVSAAKMGLVGLARALASEFAEHNIRVNVVSPGSIDT